MYSRQKPGVVQNAAELASTSPPVRPHSSRSSRFAVASGSSPGSRVPAGISSSCLRVGLAQLADERTCCPSASTATIATAPGMLDDLALVVAPALDRDVDQLPS